MAAELQPPLSPVNPPPPPPPLLPPLTTITTTTTTNATPTDTPGLAPKRHRRPSVRLGDIGDQPATLRTSKPWRLSSSPNPNPNPNSTSKTSKTRPLTNLVTAANGSFNPNSYDIPLTTTNNNGISTNYNRKFPKDFKSRRTVSAAKRPRSSNLRIDQPFLHDADNGFNRDNHIDDDDDDDNDDVEGFKDFDPEASDDAEDQEHDSADDLAHLDAWHAHNRRSIRGFGATTTTRVSDSRPDNMGLDGSDSRNRGGSDEGVKNWLVGLGLGRYAPVFEIHEVDDEVLPHLTLDDLKDMGINAVGSRRKLFFAIQKLRKGLS